MIVTRAVKIWGSTESHHFEVQVDTEADLHMVIREGKEVEDVEKAIRVVDAIMQRYLNDQYPGQVTNRPVQPQGGLRNV